MSVSCEAAGAVELVQQSGVEELGQHSGSDPEELVEHREAVESAGAVELGQHSGSDPEEGYFEHSGSEERMGPGLSSSNDSMGRRSSFHVTSTHNFSTLSSMVAVGLGAGFVSLLAAMACRGYAATFARIGEIIPLDPTFAAEDVRRGAFAQNWFYAFAVAHGLGTSGFVWIWVGSFRLMYGKDSVPPRVLLLTTCACVLTSALNTLKVLDWTWSGSKSLPLTLSVYTVMLLEVHFITKDVGRRVQESELNRWCVVFAVYGGVLVFLMSNAIPQYYFHKSDTWKIVVRVVVFQVLKKLTVELCHRGSTRLNVCNNSALHMLHFMGFAYTAVWGRVLQSEMSSFAQIVITQLLLFIPDFLTSYAHAQGSVSITSACRSTSKPLSSSDRQYFGNLAATLDVLEGAAIIGVAIVSYTANISIASRGSLDRWRLLVNSAISFSSEVLRTFVIDWCFNHFAKKHPAHWVVPSDAWPNRARGHDLFMAAVLASYLTDIMINVTWEMCVNTVMEGGEFLHIISECPAPT